MSGEIFRPGLPGNPRRIQSSKQPKKIGRPTKSFEQKKPTAQYEEASKVAKRTSLRCIAKAAALKSGQEGLKNASHIFRKLEKDPEGKAYHYRQEEKAAKRKCMFTKFTASFFTKFTKSKSPFTNLQFHISKSYF